MEREFQVVVMAGGHGNRMSPLSTSTPKALLPICNVPMVIYTLKMLERHRFSTVILVTREGAAKDLRLGMDQHSVQIEIDLVSLPDESDMGTVEALRLIKEKITTDFVVISGDLITDFELHNLADLHRLHDASATCLLKALPEKTEAELAAKVKAVERGMVDYVGIEPRSSKLILFENEENLPDDTLAMRKSVLSRHPRFKIHRDLLDAHLYIFAKWVIDFVVEDRSISTIKGELLPFLVRKQFTSFDEPSPRAAALQKVLLGAPAVGGKSVEVRCLGHVLPSLPGEADVLCVRANTTQLYSEVNRMIIPRWHQLLDVADPSKMPMIDKTMELADPKDRAKRIGSDVMVAAGCKFGAKIQIKRSIIGSHCTMGAKVSIADSIVMGHVTIGDGCTIKNSIISSNVHIGDGSSLDRVQIGTAYEVAPKSTIKNAQLVLGEVEDEDDDDLDFQ
mmetsp:Transcript_16739/g.43438  ORF Transcript_16739/g.43438 Transcript_16739/m.43438 type:complete len:450 (-) Transcript_16739:101-1450(-)